MRHHIHASLGLLQRQVTDERIIYTVRRLHRKEYCFAVNRREPFDLNLDWTANFGFDQFLCCSFTLDFSDGFQIPEPIFPGDWQNEIRGARIHKRIAAKPLFKISCVVDGDRSNYSSHLDNCSPIAILRWKCVRPFAHDLGL